MPKEKRYIEIEIEVETDEGDMTQESWDMCTKMDNDLYDYGQGFITHVSMSYETSRFNMEEKK
jgi:hypothetical protein